MNKHSIDLSTASSSSVIQEPPFLLFCLDRDWHSLQADGIDEMVATAIRRVFEMGRMLLHNEERRSVIMPFLGFMQAVYQDLLTLELQYCTPLTEVQVSPVYAEDIAALRAELVAAANQEADKHEDAFPDEGAMRRAVWEKDIAALRGKLAELIVQEADRRDHNLADVRRNLSVLDISALRRVARCLHKEKDWHVEETVREALWGEECDIAELRRRADRLRSSRVSPTDASDPLLWGATSSSDEVPEPPHLQTPSKILERLTLCVGKFYTGLAQRDAKASLADPSFVDFSLETPLAAQRFLEALDSVSQIATSLTSGGPYRGFSLVGPTEIDASGFPWGIVYAPVSSHTALSKSFVCAVHEQGHWATNVLGVADAVMWDDTLRDQLEKCSKHERDSLHDLAAENFSDAYTSLVAFGPGGVESYAVVLFSLISDYVKRLRLSSGPLTRNQSQRPSAAPSIWSKLSAWLTRAPRQPTPAKPEAPREPTFGLLLRVVGLYLLAEREKLSVGGSPEGGLDNAIDSLTLPKVALWLERLAQSPDIEPDAAATARDLVALVQEAQAAWPDMCHLGASAVDVVSCCLMRLVYPHLLYEVRKAVAANDSPSRLRNKYQFAVVLQGGRVLSDPPSLEEFSEYLAYLRQTENAPADVSLQALGANILSLAR